MAGLQGTVERDEFLPPCLRITAVAPGHVRGEVFHVYLDSRPILGKQIGWHLLFPNQPGVSALGRQRQLDPACIGFVGVLRHDDEVPLWFAGLDHSGALPAAREKAGTELALESQVTLDLSEPRARRPGSVIADQRSSGVV